MLMAWHIDTIQLPEGESHLASCKQQQIEHCLKQTPETETIRT